MAANFKFTFTDIVARQKEARRDHDDAFSSLTARHSKLSATEKAEYFRLKEIQAEIDSREKAKAPELYLDPLFVCMRQDFLPTPSGPTDSGLISMTIEQLNGVITPTKEIARIALIFGLLQLNKAPLPRLVLPKTGTSSTNPVTQVQSGGAAPTAAKTIDLVRDDAHENAPLFREALFVAVGKAAGHLPLAAAILDCLGGAVSRGGGTSSAPEDVSVSSLEYAEVFTKLVEKRVASDDPNLKRYVEESLDQVQEIGEERPLHEVDIDLPDLESSTDLAIEADHCKLMGSFIFASAFEELRAFQVVDRIVEMSQRGELPLTRGDAGTRLYNYWREAPNRMREDERQTFYAMTLGLPTGQPGVAVNTDFQDLWLRFVSSVSSLVRESRVDEILRSNLPAAINQQQVKKAARDLAINMSSHGYGMVFYAAADLQKQINDMIKLLQDKELRAAFGARDMWGVIDQVAQTELGGARNSSKYRMLATSGAIITSWMAKNVDRLRDPTLPMIELSTIANPPTRRSGETAVSNPTDYDLVNACEMWLADSAMGEERIEQMSQPRESPPQTSRPIQIPSVARELLEGAGLGLGTGMSASGNGRFNGRGNGGVAARYPGY